MNNVFSLYLGRFFPPSSRTPSWQHASLPRLWAHGVFLISLSCRKQLFRQYTLFFSNFTLLTFLAGILYSSGGVVAPRFFYTPWSLCFYFSFEDSVTFAGLYWLTSERKTSSVRSERVSKGHSVLCYRYLPPNPPPYSLSDCLQIVCLFSLPPSQARCWERPATHTLLILLRAVPWSVRSYVLSPSPAKSGWLCARLHLYTHFRDSCTLSVETRMRHQISREMGAQRKPWWCPWASWGTLGDMSYEIYGWASCWSLQGGQ